MTNYLPGTPPIGTAYTTMPKLDLAPINKVVNDDVSVILVANWYATAPSLFLSHAANVVGEVDKRSRAVSWTKWHNVLRPLHSIRALKCKFWLAAQRNA